MNCCSNSIKELTPVLIALFNLKTTAVTALNAANLLIAKPDCLPNSSISVLEEARDLLTVCC